MRIPLFFPQLFAAAGAFFKAPQTRSQVARLDAEVKAEDVVIGNGRGRWGGWMRDQWEKFKKRRKAHIARHSRNVNRRMGRTAPNLRPSSEMNFARRGAKFLARRQLQRAAG